MSVRKVNPWNFPSPQTFIMRHAPHLTLKTMPQVQRKESPCISLLLGAMIYGIMRNMLIGELVNQDHRSGDSHWYGVDPTKRVCSMKAKTMLADRSVPSLPLTHSQK